MVMQEAASQSDPMGVVPEPEPSRRRPGPPRTSRLSLYLIFVSLLALGVLPLAGDRYVHRYRADVRDLVEPARNYISEVHVALALGSAALRDFLDTSDSVFLRVYDDAVTRERAATTDLAPLAARLGRNVDSRYQNLRAAQTNWHMRVSELLSANHPDLTDVRRALTDEQAYENALVAAAGLDEALAHTTIARRQRIDRAEMMIRWLSVALATLAACAGLVALSLGRKLRHYAEATEHGRQELEQVMASRGRLARSITHDLKNPLNAIMGNLQLLELQGDGGLKPEHHERIRKAENSATSMLRMIDSLVELERAKSGQLRIERKPVDLRALLAETAENHRAVIESAGLAFHVDLAVDLEPVETDPGLVARVLGNLLGNAAKYTRRGSVSVRVAPARESTPGPGHWIAIAVQDTGPGIPAEHHEQIFEEFSRVKKSTVPGSGLGLAVSRRHARLLGGDITVTSKVGEGSTFTFWLPQQPVPDNQRHASSKAARK